MNDPELVFLDEMTTGLDPAARHTAWDLVRAVRDAGTSVVLVTHFMEEAERLCDRVAVLERGKIVALALPARSSPSTHGRSPCDFPRVRATWAGSP